MIARRWMRSVSVDLIFGVPGESLAVWQHDLKTLLALEPDHVSTYGLTFERGTAFWSRLQQGHLARLDEDLEAAMYAAAIDTLTAAGLEHYEVSNFARPGHRCRHNEIYWAGGAFTPPARSSPLVDGRRELNHRSTTTWLRRVLAGQSPVAESEVLPPVDRARELLRLRLAAAGGRRAAVVSQGHRFRDRRIGRLGAGRSGTAGLDGSRAQRRASDPGWTFRERRDLASVAAAVPTRDVALASASPGD